MAPELLNLPVPTARRRRLVARVYDLLKRVGPGQDISKAKPGTPKDKGQAWPTTPKAPGHSGAPYLHPATGKQLSHKDMAGAVSKFLTAMSAAKGAKGASGAVGGSTGAQPAKPPATGQGGAAQGDRKPVQHPGSRGGKWYRTHAGEIRYGTAPTGTPHEAIEGPPQAQDFKAGQEVTWQGRGGTHSGDITKVGATGLLVKVGGADEAYHVPFDQVKGTKNPPPESKQTVTPEQLKVGAIVQFQANGALQHGKVRSWGKQGARIVTHDGEFDVAFQDIKGMGVHPDVAAEQPDVMAQGAANAAGPATPQEDAPLRPTKYTLEDFQEGQHVTAEAPNGQGGKEQFSGTVMAVQEQGNAQGMGFVKVRLDTAHPSGIGEALLLPHEITGIDEPKGPKGEKATESGTSGKQGAGAKGNGGVGEGKAEGKARAVPGDVVTVKIGDHTYPPVTVGDTFEDGFKGVYTLPSGMVAGGHFSWDEVTGKAKPEPEHPAVAAMNQDVEAKPKRETMEEGGWVKPGPEPGDAASSQELLKLQQTATKMGWLPEDDDNTDGGTSFSLDVEGSDKSYRLDIDGNGDWEIGDVESGQTIANGSGSAELGAKTKEISDPAFESKHARDASGRFTKMTDQIEDSGWTKGPLGTYVKKVGDQAFEMEITKDGAWTLTNNDGLVTKGTAAEEMSKFGLALKHVAGYETPELDKKPTVAPGHKVLEAKDVEVGHKVKFLSAQGTPREGTIVSGVTSNNTVGVKTGVSGWIYKVPLSSVTYHNNMAVNGGPHAVHESFQAKGKIKADKVTVGAAGAQGAQGAAQGPAGAQGAQQATLEGSTPDQQAFHDGLAKQGWKLQPELSGETVRYKNPKVPGMLEIYKDGTWSHYNAAGKGVAYGQAVTPTDIIGFHEAVAKKPKDLGDVVKEATASAKTTADDLMDAANKTPEKPALPEGETKEEMVAPGLKKITVMPKSTFEPEKLSKPLDFMNWGGTGKAGPSSVKEKNEANQAAVNAIYKAAQTGNLENIKSLVFPTVLGKEGKVEGEGPEAKALEHPSQHVKGYAQQLINELTEQQHPTEHVYFELEGEHPIKAISQGVKPLTNPAARQAHIAAGKTIAHYLDLGKVPPLAKELYAALFPEKAASQNEAQSISLMQKLSQKVAKLIPEHMKAAIRSLKNSSKNIGAWTGNQPEAIKKASQAIHQYGFFVPPNVQIERHISLHGAHLQQIVGSEGHIIQEMGWSHTGQWSGNVHLRMRAAPGVKMLYVASGSGISSSHGGENESGLPADTRMWVQKVTQNGDKVTLDIIVLPHDEDSYPGAGKVPKGYTAPEGGAATPTPETTTPSYQPGPPKPTIWKIKKQAKVGSHFKSEKTGNVYKVTGYSGGKVHTLHVQNKAGAIPAPVAKDFTYHLMKNAWGQQFKAF